MLRLSTQNEKKKSDFLSSDFLIIIAENKQAKMIADYIAKTGKSFSTSAAGLYYSIEKPGAGASPKMGETWMVNYRGTFLNGKEFDKGKINRSHRFI